MIFRTLLALLAALLLGGCAGGMIHDAAAHRLSQAARVGVVSAMGTSFHRAYVGYTVFGNESAPPENVASWDLDTVIEEAAIEGARKSAGLKVERVALKPEERALLRAGRSLVDGSPSQRDRILGIARAQGFDAVILVVGADDAIQRDFMRGGLGYLRHVLQTRQGGCVYAFFRLDIHSTHNGNVLGWGTANQRCRYLVLGTDWTPTTSRFAREEGALRAEAVALARVAVDEAVAPAIQRAYK